jgi:hypothetical protein
MSVERVIARYRAEAARLRARKGVGRDAGMDEYFWTQKALAYDEVCNALEEDARQSGRVHQDRT